ncbi:MAG: hypothetical protein II685_01585, partial [Clostridia bacterium]|nr:hypothetical protein [Clostridia bacterium]
MMGIICTEIGGGKLFKLDTPNSSYIFRTADADGFILHMYYGKRIAGTGLDDLARIEEPPFLPSGNERERCSFMDCAPFEYPGHGLGDFRDDAFSVINKDGYFATSINYRSHRIYPGKPAIEGLPATFGNENDCTTLEIKAADEANGLEIILYYSVFEDVDAIARSVKIRNTGAAFKSGEPNNTVKITDSNDTGIYCKNNDNNKNSN